MSLFGAGIGGSALGRVLVEVGLDARPLEAGMAQAKGTAKTGATGIGTTMSTAIKAGAVLAGAAVIKFGADSVKAYEESQVAGQQLANTIKNHSQLLDVTTQSWEDQSHAIQELTGIQDEEITSAQAMLGAFDLTGKQVQDLIPLVVDLSQKYGIDMTSAVKAVGKATDGNTASLKRYGISINTGKDGVASFTDVMDGLRSSVGGFSESISGNFSTRMAVLSANFDDIKEKVGQALVPVLEDLAGILQHMMPLVSFAAAHWKELLGAFLAFKGAQAVVGIMGKLNFALNGLSTASGGLGKIVQGMAGLTTPVIIGGLLDIAAAFADIKLAIDVARGDISDWTEKMDTAVLHAKGWDKVAPAIDGVRFSIAQLSKEKPPIFADPAAFKQAQQWNAAVAGLSAAYDRNHGAADGLTTATEHLAAAEKKAEEAAQNLRLAQLSLAGGFLGIESAAMQAAQAHDDLVAAQRKVATMTENGKQGTKAYRDALANLRSAGDDALQSQLGLAGAVQQYIKENGESAASTARAKELIRAYGADAGMTAGQVNALIGRVMGLIAANRGLPPSKSTQYTFNDNGALSRVQQIKSYIDSLHDKEVNIYVYTHLRQDV